MLRSLHVENYVLIDSLDIDFPEGLVIVTGQTGAGKSILLGALSLLAGAKADADAILAGASSCVVEACFQNVPDNLDAILENGEVEKAQDGSLVVRRVVYPTGRSRAFVNDCPVALSLLSDISDRLFDIHSQHRSLILRDKSWQLSVLDSFAGSTSAARKVSSLWKEILVRRCEISKLHEEIQRLEMDREYNQARFQALDSAALKEGELEELEMEEKQLSNAGQIREDLSGAFGFLNPTSDRIPPVGESLREARKLLGKVSAYIPEASSIAGRLESSRIEIEDISCEIERLQAGIDISPSRLQEVTQRLSLIYDLFRKFGVRSVGELIELKAKYAGCVENTDTLALRERELVKELAGLQKEHALACAALSEARRKAAPLFAAKIVESVRFLELDRAVFKVGFEPCEAGPAGSERVSFLFDANGNEPADISRCASGGEMSRFMLCLKSVMAGFAGMPTMFFDEIDTGVSGSAASKMGSLICEMGKDLQVIAITHLPQVAAKGKAHFLVEKKSVEQGGAVRTTIRRIEGRQRVMEIARLLSGETITPQAVANAESLL